jgi:hypothetical protein
MGDRVGQSTFLGHRNPKTLVRLSQTSIDSKGFLELRNGLINLRLLRQCNPEIDSISKLPFTN